MGLFYDLKSKFIAWFGDIKVYPYPMFIMFGHSSYKINGNDQREIMDCIKPGDVLLRRYDHYLSGLGIPGYFTHAAMYMGDNNVIHMLGDGITKEDILTFMRCDNIAVMRYTKEEMIPDAIECANKQLAKGIEYDFDFDFQNADKFSCTELIHHCFHYFSLNNPLRENMILPDDILNSDLFTTIWKKRKS